MWGLISVLIHPVSHGYREVPMETAGLGAQRNERNVDIMIKCFVFPFHLPIYQSVST